jgi:predicted CoA-binding protein
MRAKEHNQMPLTEPQDIADLLQNARTIALVGASDRPDRASYGVMKFLQDQGYRVIPVNPRITGEHVHGEFIWRELAQIGEPIDIVDIFMRSETVGPIVDDAIAVGAKAVWMQLGVVNDEAAAKAEAAGLKVVMDHCPKIEFARLGLKPVNRQA